MATNVLAHLEREAGTSDHWTTAQIFSILNFLYRLSADNYRNVIEKFTQVDLAIQTDLTYLLPEKLLSVDEVLYASDTTSDQEALDPTSLYQIKIMDTSWRLRTGIPDWYCLDYIEGYLLLWRFPSAVTPGITVTGPVIPTALLTTQSPSVPYKNGNILEPGAVSFALSQEGPGQNLERSNYWYDIFLNALASLNKSKTPSMDHAIKSVDEGRGQPRGPRLPSNYPSYPWRGR
jgi:hypothetical protein